ncbi:MAG TPA: ATP-binding protein [Methylophilaceae bacterium]|nr:ATP-binding protein [Methylophilaceae bacterium]
MTDAVARDDRGVAKTYWRSLGYLGYYRITIALLFLGAYLFLGHDIWWNNYNSQLYFALSSSYLFFGLFASGLTFVQWPRFNHLLTLQISIDIVFIVSLMYSVGGIKSGVGLLLVVAIAAASLISQGRLALFYAALASIALLLEQSYRMLTVQGDVNDYSHAVMLSLSCFATAWLAHSLAKRSDQSEALASQRGIDLENLAQVNELITQEMQDGVVVIDREFRLRHHNLQAEGLLKPLQPNWEAILVDHCLPELARLMRQWVEDGLDASTIRLQAEQRELILRFMPVGHTRDQGAVIFIEDWSQIQAQAQQLKLAALGKLTANIAHEIRNPLSSISHASQLLQEDEGRDLASARLLQIIDDNVQRMDLMVKDILELNRRDRTRQEAIEVQAFLLEFHAEFCQVEKIPQHGFLLELAGEALAIHFDRRHLNQILWNLCRNGWRHSRQADGSLRLHLRLSQLSHGVLLEIADDGPGVAADMRQHLFEPFFTTESTGTGLGLYIARELCEANAASIHYTGHDFGGSFTIHIKQYAPETLP